jgi:hypothetical protein
VGLDRPNSNILQDAKQVHDYYITLVFFVRSSDKKNVVNYFGPRLNRGVLECILAQAAITVFKKRTNLYHDVD